MRQSRRLPCWLSRCRTGRYLITYHHPQLAQVGNTEHVDLYARPGDPLAWREMCPESINIMFGVELEPMETRRAWFQGGIRERSEDLTR